MIETATAKNTWIPTGEAAARLRKSAETLANWANAGRIPSHAWRRMPKGLLFLESWVNDPVIVEIRPPLPPSETGDDR